MDNSMNSPMPFSRRAVKRVDEAAIEEHEFSVVTYNILADYWIRQNSVTKSKYSYCPTEFKMRIQGKNSHRHKLLMSELRWLDSDILCLQEVDTAYFTEILRDELSLLGYEALFAEKSMGCPEGVALFFRRDKFHLEKTKKMNISDLAQCTLKQRDFLKVEEVLLLAALRHTTSDSLLVMGVTHLTWGQLSKTVTQVCEIALVTQTLGDMVTSLEAQGEHVSHILCGDFNIEPQFPAYEFLKEGRLTDKELKRLKTVDYIRFSSDTEEPTKILPDQLSLLNRTKGHLHSPLTKLQSAYKNVMGTEPQCTNHEGEGNIWTLDYIWFDANSLSVTAALETVPKSAITPYGGLPNKFFPSDHLSLKAYFKFINKTKLQDKP